MISMKLSKERQEKMPKETVLGGPEYPYGLHIELNNDGLDKLGIEGLPDINSSIAIRAIVKVTMVNISKNENNKKANRRVGLQITDMEIVGIKKDDDTAAKFYKKVDGDNRPVNFVEGF